MSDVKVLLLYSLHSFHYSKDSKIHVESSQMIQGRIIYHAIRKNN